MSEYKWDIPPQPNNTIVEGAVCTVDGQFDFVFEWSNQIIDEFDYETGKILSYKSGWLMRPIPRTYVYNNQPHVKLYTTIKNGE